MADDVETFKKIVELLSNSVSNIKNETGEKADFKEVAVLFEEDIFNKIAERLPGTDMIFSEFTRKAWGLLDKKYFPEVADMLQKACNLLSEKAEAGKGYHTRVLGEFVYRGIHSFKGFHLTLIGPGNEHVGALGFKIGMPFEITTIQGHNNSAPMEFAKATGTTFDAALMERFVHCIGSTIYFPQGHPLRNEHKAVLRLEHSITNKKLERRLLNRYFPRNVRTVWPNGTIAYDVPKLYVKENHFARVRRKMQKQAIIR